MSEPRETLPTTAGGVRKSKIIAKEDLTAYQRWEQPLVEGGMERPAGLMTAKDLEHIQKQAYDEGFALGQQEGREQMLVQARRLEELLYALHEPFEDLDQQVEQELVQLAMSVARQLVRRELKIDPGAVMAVVRETMASLPVSSRQVSVHLHPEDAALVRSALSLSESERSWQIFDDPVLARGDCRAITETSQIDATLDTRLTSLITAMLGGDRKDDENRS